jgi:hypothetical protein
MANVISATATTGSVWIENFGTNTKLRVKVNSSASSTAGYYYATKDYYPTTVTGSWSVTANRKPRHGWTDCYSYTNNSELTSDWVSDSDWHSVLTPEEMKAREEKQLKNKISEIIKNRCMPNVIIRNNTKREPLPIPADIREQRARETLRRVIGNDKFTNFIKHGFVSVKARSGLIYQIFTGHGITHVYDQGKLVERLCVVLQGNFPPTDSLIMRFLLILNNEQQFRSLAVKHSISGYQKNERSNQSNGPVVMKPLAEIFKELKKKVA